MRGYNSNFTIHNSQFTFLISHFPWFVESKQPKSHADAGECMWIFHHRFYPFFFSLFPFLEPTSSKGADIVGPNSWKCNERSNIYRRDCGWMHGRTSEVGISGISDMEVNVVGKVVLPWMWYLRNEPIDSTFDSTHFGCPHWARMETRKSTRCLSQRYRFR